MEKPAAHFSSLLCSLIIVKRIWKIVVTSLRVVAGSNRLLWHGWLTHHNDNNRTLLGDLGNRISVACGLGNTEYHIQVSEHLHGSCDLHGEFGMGIHMYILSPETYKKIISNQGIVSWSVMFVKHSTSVRNFIVLEYAFFFWFLRKITGWIFSHSNKIGSGMCV